MKIIAFLAAIILIIIVGSVFLKTPANNNNSVNKIIVIPPVKTIEFLWAGRSISDPFLIGTNGKLVSPAKEYADSLARFPNLPSCLAPSEQEKKPPENIDALRFDWAAIRSESDFDVCVFHVGNALADIEKFASWFTLSGFKVRTDQSSTDMAGRIISVTWDPSVNGAMSPYPRPILQEWVERLLSNHRAFNASIILNENQEVTSISSGISFK